MKKKLLSLFLLSSFILPATSQVTRLSNNTSFDWGFSLTNTKIILRSAVTKTIWVYDVAGNSFTQLSTVVTVEGDYQFQVMNGKVYFRGKSPAEGIELWSTDGTPIGTGIVKNINPGNADSEPDNGFVIYNNELYFSANDGTTGRELWKTNGTEAGTVRVKDINPTGNAFPTSAVFTPGTNFGVVNGVLVFTASSQITPGIPPLGDIADQELWKTDGTDAGTTLLKDIYLGPNASYISNFTQYGTDLIFTAFDPDNGDALWKTNGTAAGTVLIKDIDGSDPIDPPFYFSLPSITPSFFNFQNTLYFVAKDATNGFELWKTNATTAGTSLVKDINPGTADGFPFGFPSLSLAAKNGNKFFFSATTNNEGTELWESDGTSPGTSLLKDIATGVGNSSDVITIPNFLTSGLFQGNKFFLIANTAAEGKELWISDGTAGGTHLVKDIYPGTEDGIAGSFLIYTADKAYFTANHPTYGEEIWQTDGTGPGTSLVQDVNTTPTPAANSNIQFATIASNTIFLFGTDGDDAVNTDFFKLNLSVPPLNIIYPKLYLSTSSINVGQSTNITGADFRSNGITKLNISGPDGYLQSHRLTSTINGAFIYSFTTNTSMAAGIYNVWAIDSISGISSTVKFFLLINNTTPISNLKITSPNITASSRVSNPIKIGWSDKPSHISALIPNTSSVNALYKIEYNKDNSGWQLITIKSFKGYYKQLSNFQYTVSPSQTGVYQFRVTDILDTQNNDVSAVLNVNDPISGAKIEYAWDFSGNRPNEKPIGVVADGTARIYVKFLKKTGNNKTISNVSVAVTDPIYPAIAESRLLGKLLKANDTSGYSKEANAATLTNANSNTSGLGNVFWFWYVAPDDFVRNTNDTLKSIRKLNLEAIVTYSDNSTDNVAEEIEIIRPPVMFVHGIGGSEESWDDFFYSMNGTPRYFTIEKDSPWKFRRALNMYPAGSFKQNAQLLLTLTNSGFKLNSDIAESYNVNSFQYFLQQMRNKKYSCNRVDYVAHSMGGDMARAAINFYSSEYKPSETLQRKFKNYDKGFINKLITLNTPHNGSPLADLTIEKFSQNTIAKNLFQGSYSSGFESYLISSFFNTIANTNKLDFNSPTEALKNLRFGVSGVKFEVSNVENHLIAGDLLIGGEDCLDAYNIIKNDQDLGLIYKLFAAIGGTSCIAVDDKFAAYGVTDFIENSDLVVPLSSELPGKDISGSGSNYSIYYGVKPNHLSICNSNNNPSVGQKVIQLLNASIMGGSFANNIAKNTSTGTEIYRQTSVNNFFELIDTNKIVITNPIRGTSYSVDSIINISVKLKDTLNFKYLNVLLQSNIYTSVSKATTQSFNVQVNPVYVDSQTIVATAVYDSSGNDVYYTDTLSLNILKDPLINDFYVTPTTKYLNNGQTYIPTYNLIHNSYITNVSIMDTALHIFITDPNVVTYSNIEKNFIAKDTGTTYIIFNYKGFVDTMFVIISLDEPKSNIICPGSPASFAVPTEGGSTFQWQVDTGVGFMNITDDAIYSGATSNILTLTGAPTSWYGYRYQCIVSNGMGSSYTDHVVLKFSLSWSGASNTAWENTANWSCGVLPDSNTDVLISTSVNYPQVNSNVSCRSLTIQPGSTILVKPGNRIDVTGQ